MICIGLFIDMIFLYAQFPRNVRVSSDTFNYIDDSATMVFYQTVELLLHPNQYIQRSETVSSVYGIFRR